MGDSEFSAFESDISPTEKFKQYLLTQGKQFNRVREIIVAEVFSSQEPFETEQLAVRLANKKDEKRVSRATIYQTLQAMEFAGLLRKVTGPNGREVWEHHG
jgi:Fe2+ or Zn2+ uptake regulation protein